MKQITVYSGKGGTGKTTVTASLAALAENGLFADCDVDAANLHLILQPVPKEEHRFIGGKKGVIDPQKCTGCGDCERVCRFDAVSVPEINVFACEGCGVCAKICPAEAITMEQGDAGAWYKGETKYGPMVYAELKAGEDNSGKLVAEVRKNSTSTAESLGKEYIIIDGPPGTGCAVMASLTGTDLAVLVTEPTVSGIHDMERAVDVARHFSLPVGVVVNKYDLNEEKTADIVRYCESAGIPFFGKIRYSKSVVESVSALVPYVDYKQDDITESLKKIWEKITKSINSGGS